MSSSQNNTDSGSEPEARYDAVIVGSGYGGGVAASRLARMGLRVCVLEKGRKWRPGDFSNSIAGFVKRTLLNGRFFKMGKKNALFDIRTGKQLHVLTACGLGGGSLVNAGLAIRPEAWVFDQKKWPREISQGDHLETGFQRSMRMLGVSHCPGGEQLLKYKSLQTCAEALDSTAELVPSTISYEPGFNQANVLQNACTQCGDCWIGCNVGAKKTVANTYLADAQNHGAMVFANMNVSAVQKNSQEGQQAEVGWQVAFERLNEESGKVESEGVVQADLLIISAGVLGTAGILMRARDKGLPLSDRLGHGFSANGDDIAFGHDMPVTVNGIAVGHPANSKTEPVGPNCIGSISVKDEVRRDHSFSIQAGTMMPLMATIAPLKSILRGRLLRAISTLKNGAYKGVLTKSQCFYIVGHDEADGKLQLERGEVRVDWPKAKEQTIFKRSKQIIENMLKRLGADYMQNPVRDRLLGGKLVTVHPLGGCVMGETMQEGVVDHRGRVFDASSPEKPNALHEGLYVIDGSIVPTSLGANPLLTIAALAERAMILLAKERGLDLDVSPKQDAPARDAFM